MILARFPCAPYLHLGLLLCLVLGAPARSARADEAPRLSLPSHLADRPPLRLESAQRQRLADGLRVGVSMADQAPIERVTERGRYLGISAEYLALLEASLDTRLTVIGYRNRLDAIQAMRRGELDLVASASEKIRGLPHVALSSPYLADHSVVVTRRPASARPGVDGPGAVPVGGKIGLLDDDRRSSPDLMEQAYPGSPIVGHRDLFSALEGVRRGDVDAYIGNELIVRSHLALRPDPGWHLSAAPRLADTGFSFARREDDQRLGALLELALTDIPPLRRLEVERRWAGGLGAALGASQLHLSEAERAWIAKHPRVRVAATHYPPYIQRNAEGHWRGLHHDILQRIGGMTGLNFDHVFFDSVSARVQAVRDDQADMSTTLWENPGRGDYLLFSQGLSEQHWVFVESLQRPPVTSLQALAGEVLALPADHVLVAWLNTHHPQIIVRPVQSAQQARALVMAGKARATLDIEASALHALAGTPPGSLRLGARVDTAPVSERFAVSQRHPLLLSILDKALQTLPVDELRNTQVRWLGAPGEPATAWWRVPPWAWWAAAAVLLFGLASAFWSTRLRRQVRQCQRLERQLIEARRQAEQANQAKSLFLTTVTHDMRTPLSAIIGLLELAQMHGQGNSMLLQTARESAQELVMLIGDTLDIARIEAGKLDLAPQATDLHAFLQGTLDLFVGLARQRGLALRLVVDPPAHGRYCLDPLRVRQVLNNLLGNALKFTTHGSVLLSARWQAETLVLEVSDTGSGVPPERLERLFLPFSQDLAEATRAERGTGLGLSICKQLVQLMQGTITLHSQPGEGTRVVLELPLQRLDDEPRTVSESAPVFSEATLRALAPDDPAGLRRLRMELARNLQAEAKALRAATPEQRVVCVHRLNGIACLVDAEPLARACCTVEQAVEEDCSQQIEVLLTTIGQLLDALYKDQTEMD
jgi:signal transduction histidine kinase/HPt (histidine-containing phosphotransfer) domain-containing protein